MGRRPQTDSAVEAFIRQKYEKKKYILANWQPSKPPDFPIGFDLGDEAANNLSRAKAEVAKKVVLPARSPTAPVTSRPTVAKTEPSRPVTASVPPSASSDLLAEFGDFTSAVAPAPVAQNQSSSSDLFGAMSQPAPAAKCPSSIIPS